MLLWRLSGAEHARTFDGGYGLLFNGRWNVAGNPVTYCATSPSLCVLEKLVHIEDPRLLPELTMVAYDVPDDLGFDDIGLDDLPEDWRRQEGLTQRLGEQWREAREHALLRVPSAVVPFEDSPDLNIVVNHAHPGVAAITVHLLAPFSLDPRLL